MPPGRPCPRLIAHLCLATALPPAGCGFEPYRSEYVLDEWQVVMAIRLRVVEAGTWATDLSNVPQGRYRAEVLPGDTVAVDAIVASEDGELDLVESDPWWLLCSRSCLSLRREELAPCQTAPADHPNLGCIAGRGSSAVFQLPREAVAEDALYLPSELMMIAGIPGQRSSDDCLEALYARPRTNIDGCVIGRRSLPYGPWWTIGEIRSLSPYFDADNAFAPPPADVLAAFPPNLEPQISRIAFGPLPDDGELPDPLPTVEVGEPLRLRVGEAFFLQPLDDDFEVVLRPGSDPLTWIGEAEARFAHLYTTSPELITPPGGFPQGYGSETRPIEGVAPDEAGDYVGYLIVSDERAGRNWIRLHFEVSAR